MKVKAGVTGAYISFRNLVEISSGSVALCWFRPCRSLYTPFWVTVICGASFKAKHLKTGNWLMYHLSLKREIKANQQTIDRFH
jgi:hypothetical protein